MMKVTVSFQESSSSQPHSGERDRSIKIKIPLGIRFCHEESDSFCMILYVPSQMQKKMSTENERKNYLEGTLREAVAFSFEYKWVNCSTGAGPDHHLLVPAKIS